jgi:pre-mRNA-processing factor 40
MNRPNGARFQPQGPVFDNGLGMAPGGRGNPSFQQSRGLPPHHPSQMTQGRGMFGRPPPVAGVGPRNQPMGNYVNGGGHIPLHRGEFPPPAMAGNRPPPPPPPPQFGRTQIPMNRRHSQGPLSPNKMHHDHNTQSFPPHLSPMNPMVSRSASLPPSIPPPPQQKHPFPLHLNSGIPPVLINANRVPPPPPYPLQSTYSQQNSHIQPTFHVSQNQNLVGGATPSPIHDPRLRGPESLPCNINQYNQNVHQSNFQHSSLLVSGVGSQRNLQPPHFSKNTVGTSYSQQQIDDSWTEHVAANGTVYYHNSVLRTSTYDKPESMKRKGAMIDVKNTDTIAKPWKQYKDSNTGKLYYSNGVVTTWDKPDGFVDLEAATESITSEPPKKKKKVRSEAVKFNSKEEAITVFKGLLLAKEVSPSAKWNDVSKLCPSDPKWEACEEALTPGERKQALAEYQTKRGNDLRDHERKEKIRTREAFSQLLMETVADMKKFNAWTTSFNDMRELLAKDARFHAVEVESSRESLFLDFCEEFKKREERRKRAMKRDAQDSFDAFLLEQEKNGKLTFASTWNSFYSSLDELDRKDPRLETTPYMSDSDRQLYFTDFVIKLQKFEEDRRNRIRGARQRAEKAQREVFVDDMRNLAKSGKICSTSSWRSVETLISTLPSYIAVYDQGRQDPREIFEDFVCEWDDMYRRERAFLAQLVHPSSVAQIVVTPSTSFEDFRLMLLDAVDNSPDMSQELSRILDRCEPISSAQIYLEELLLESVDQNGTVAARRGNVWRRPDDSSEDEGEIIEDGGE